MSSVSKPGQDIETPKDGNGKKIHISKKNLRIMSVKLPSDNPKVIAGKAYIHNFF